MNADDRKSQRIWIQGVVNGAPTSIEVFAPGTKVGFEDLATDDPPSPWRRARFIKDQVDHLRALGDMQSAASDHVLGIDGIAVIVNRQNRVSKLGVKQLAGIFGGDTTNLVAGGRRRHADSPLRARHQVGDFDAFQAMVLNSRDPKGDPRPSRTARLSRTPYRRTRRRWVRGSTLRQRHQGGRRAGW